MWENSLLFVGFYVILMYDTSAAQAEKAAGDGYAVPAPHREYAERIKSSQIGQQWRFSVRACIDIRHIRLADRTSL